MTFTPAIAVFHTPCRSMATAGAVPFAPQSRTASRNSLDAPTGDVMCRVPTGIDRLASGRPLHSTAARDGRLSDIRTETGGTAYDVTGLAQLRCKVSNNSPRPVCERVRNLVVGAGQFRAWSARQIERVDA